MFALNGDHMSGLGVCKFAAELFLSLVVTNNECNFNYSHKAVGQYHIII